MTELLMGRVLQAPCLGASVPQAGASRGLHVLPFPQGVYSDLAAHCDDKFPVAETTGPAWGWAYSKCKIRACTEWPLLHTWQAVLPLRDDQATYSTHPRIPKLDPKRRHLWLFCKPKYDSVPPQSKIFIAPQCPEKTTPL